MSRESRKRYKMSEKGEAARRRYYKTENGKAAMKKAQCKFHLMQRHGMTVQERDIIAKKQNNRCAICGIDFGSTEKGPSVDHDHTTGNIRGLLCVGCNIGLGHFKDDVPRLQRAIDYLNKFHKES